MSNELVSENWDLLDRDTMKASCEGPLLNLVFGCVCSGCTFQFNALGREETQGEAAVLKDGDIVGWLVEQHVDSYDQVDRSGLPADVDGT